MANNKKNKSPKANAKKAEKKVEVCNMGGRRLKGLPKGPEIIKETSCPGAYKSL